MPGQLLNALEVPTLFKILDGGVAVTRTLRLNALRMLHAAMLAATNELIPVSCMLGCAVLCRAVRVPTQMTFAVKALLREKSFTTHH